MSRTIQSQHRIRIDAPADVAFMFFTPAGEELWVEGWRPRYVHPADGATVAGMVFTTGDGAELTIWHLVDFDRARRRSRYVRTTPGSRTGFVEIACEPLDAERCEVTVRYTMTALSAEGEAALEAFTPAAFARSIDGWGERIAACLPQLRTAHIR
ncbi:MAG TPA: SRPBCC family protein [Lysobacter sp.]|nr:SRPBCC family protein [Lysobacter sp.]